jgi:phosphoglycolate phosphatase
MDYALLSFDLDGTLVDTASEIAEAANRTLSAMGLDRIPPPQITQLIGHGAHALMRKLLRQVRQGETADMGAWPEAAVLRAFDAHYADTVGSSAVPYPGAGEALQRLRAAGVKLACTTNKELRHAQRVLHANRLDSYFHLVVGGDSLPWQKPDAGVLQTVAERLGAQLAHTAHVGDSAIDIAAARNAGVAAWAVPYGYNGGAAIASSEPDRIFDRLEEVADHVLAGRAATAR